MTSSTSRFVTFAHTHLDLEAGALSATAPECETSTEYDAVTGSTVLSYVFIQETEVCGFLKLKAWVGSAGANDIDLFALATTVTANGEEEDDTEEAVRGRLVGAAPAGVGHGQLRVSLRELEQGRSTDWKPVPALEAHEYLTEGQMVPAELSLRAAAMIFHPGDSLRLELAGNLLAPPAGTDVTNSGTHIVTSGGDRDS